MVFPRRYSNFCFQPLVFRGVFLVSWVTLPRHLGSWKRGNGSWSASMAVLGKGKPSSCHLHRRCWMGFGISVKSWVAYIFPGWNWPRAGDDECLLRRKWKNSAESPSSQRFLGLFSSPLDLGRFFPLWLVFLSDGSDGSKSQLSIHCFYSEVQDIVLLPIQDFWDTNCAQRTTFPGMEGVCFIVTLECRKVVPFCGLLKPSIVFELFFFESFGSLLFETS